jgi:hypothetical protein
MNALRRLLRRVRRFDARVTYAFGLWARLDITWSEAWRCSRTWQ